MDVDDLNEVNNLLTRLNEQMDPWSETGENFFYDNGVILLSLEVYDSEHCIMYLGNTIWTTTDDEREWIEENDDYEELEVFLIRMVKKFNEKIKELVV